MDGNEGWRKALAEHPDLIVSDISMPAMNGIDLCRKISGDERTGQIPVILLTAMSGEGAELNGLRTGAIDYIIKPFNFELLLSKIRNVLAHNATVKKTYQRQIQAATPAALKIESADEAFVQSVLKHIEKNIGNADFSVGELSQQFHASRSTFYKRLLLLTGKTPIEFIRHIRLKRAAELLEKSQLTVSEIAYSVGLKNPKNLSQYIKDEFSPDTLRLSLRKTRKSRLAPPATPRLRSPAPPPGSPPPGSPPPAAPPPPENTVFIRLPDRDPSLTFKAENSSLPPPFPQPLSNSTIYLSLSKFFLCQQLKKTGKTGCPNITSGSLIANINILRNISNWESPTQQKRSQPRLSCEDNQTGSP